MAEVDKRNKFAEEIFSYRVNKDNKVAIYWYGKPVMILKGRKAEKFMQKMTLLEDKEAQLLMAKVTGNFKRGNERSSK